LSDLIGRTIGPHQIIEKLGQGGMAEVYRAYHTLLGSYRAIKIMLPWMAQDTQFVERFRREALAHGGLRHPNIVQVYDAGEFEGRPYIVMDYIAGGTLADRLRRGPVAPEEAASLVAQVADALDYAHHQRPPLIHRDVKPSNILLDEGGRPVLVDFGIAQAVSSGPRLTSFGQSIGTPEYMSPEQSQGLGVDARSDVYSLGIVLYEMAAGRVPFRGASITDVGYQVVHVPPAPPRQLNPHTPPYLESVILRALAKRPEDRFQTAGEMAQALRDRRVVTAVPAAAAAAAPVPPVGARTGGKGSAAPIPQAAPPRRSKGLVVALVLVLAAVVALGGAVVFLLLRGGSMGGVTAGVTPTMPAEVAYVEPTLIPLPPTATVPAPTAEPVVTVLVVTATGAPGVAPATTTARTAEPTPLPPTPTPTPSPAPTTTPPPTPTARPTVKPATAAPAQPASSSGAVLDFETFGTWKRGNEPYGTFTQAKDPVHGGSASAKLTYEIPQVDKHYVVFSRAVAAPIAGQPDALTMWVYGDGSGHFLNTWIKDSQAEVRQFTFGQVNHTGWQPMTLKLDTGAPWPQTHISGPDNGKLDFPISLQSFVLDVVPRSGASSYSGSIYLDDLTVGSTGAASMGVAAPSVAAPAVAAPQPTAAAPAAAVSCPGGHIVFAQGSGGTTDLMVLDVAGKGVSLLFPNARQPDLRGDGRVILNATGDGKDNLFAINVNGGGERMVSPHPEDSYPQWSRTGESAVFFSTQQGDGKERIYIQWNTNQVEEPQMMQINGRDAFGRDPTWLPTGRVAFSGCDYWEAGGRCGIWTVNADGTGPVRLTERMQDRSTDASGSTLLFTSDVSGNWEVYAIAAAGGTPRNLTNSPSQDAGATFSPDGRCIAFLSNRDGWGIWVMPAAGGAAQKLIGVPTGFGNAWPEERLAWGP
jgi:hypothetical protein